MSYGLGISAVPPIGFPTDPSADELDAICRSQPCGSSLCPCPPGMRPGQVPANIQQLPELTVRGVPEYYILFAVVALVIGSVLGSRGRRY